MYNQQFFSFPHPFFSIFSQLPFTKGGRGGDFSPAIAGTGFAGGQAAMGNY
jgi:hypothetical protein